MKSPAPWFGFLCLSLCATSPPGAEPFTLHNAILKADFDSNGLVRLTLQESKGTLALANDSAGLAVNGQPIALEKAYSDVFPLGRERTFTGFYADVSQLEPATPYQVEVTLPDTLQPGQFQGLFFENVEAEFTEEIQSQ